MCLQMIFLCKASCVFQQNTMLGFTNLAWNHAAASRSIDLTDETLVMNARSKILKIEQLEQTCRVHLRHSDATNTFIYL